MVTGAAHPAAEAAGVRAAPARPDVNPLWALPRADIVTARGGTAPHGAPVRGWLLAARLSPPAERQWAAVPSRSRYPPV